MWKILLFLFYVIGDFITTVLIYELPYIRESNHMVDYIYTNYTMFGFLIIKLIMFFGIVYLLKYIYGFKYIYNNKTYDFRLFALVPYAILLFGSIFITLSNISLVLFGVSLFQHIGLM